MYVLMKTYGYSKYMGKQIFGTTVDLQHNSSGGENITRSMYWYCKGTGNARQARKSINDGSELRHQDNGDE